MPNYVTPLQVQLTPQASAMEWYYPSNMTECMAKIDAGFGMVQAKQGACQAFITNECPEALEAMAMGAQAANQVIYASWCKAKATAIKNGGNGELVIDPSDEPPFPVNEAECIMNIDSHMPSDQRKDVCKELFSAGNNKDTMLAFSKDAEDAGYPIAAEWFKYVAERDVPASPASRIHFEKYKTYYIVGGVTIFTLAALGIGIALGRD